MTIGGYAFVLGGGSGISRSTSIAFAKEGARGLLVADINLEAATKTALDSKAVATNPDFRAEAIQIDVTVQESVQHATTHMVETFGRIDYCVNGAAITSSEFEGVADASFTQFKSVMDVNVNGTFLVLNAVSAAMKSQEPQVIDDSMPARGVSRGSIVNLASVYAFKGLPREIGYDASKHAIVGMTRTAALDNVKHNIRVNCVCPSWVDTPMVARICEKFPSFAQAIQASLPMGRMAFPEEIADAIIFLSSPKASWVNGSSMMVDGAMSVR
ncbi:hypothetical protein F5B20DRAFT_575457 [Whalleya microplaca]|nr:hypothetical protein F5B20DRAFT_575457 [Whalleya microplaca]